MMCPCGKNLKFSECCEPYIEGKKSPTTAEDLMRSRYSAFATGKIEYLRDTLTAAEQRDFDMASTREWAQKSKWLGLQILSTEKGQPSDKIGTVEFIAKYESDGKVLEHHEVSKFKKDQKGHWFFSDGDSHTHEEGQGHHHASHAPRVREEPKVGRNDPCHCGSGKKFKKCHGA